MSNTEMQKIKTLLEETFNGNAWHGPSVMEVLSALTIEETLNQIADSHTITELVEHMITWRKFVIKKIEGDVNYDVAPETNFRSISKMTELDWEDMLTQLQLTQGNLLNLLAGTKDKKLEEVVPGRDYTFYTLLHGIIHHDLYHLGQIVLMRKL